MSSGKDIKIINENEKTVDFQLNVKPFIAVGLAYNQRTRFKINTMYEKYKSKAYTYMKNSEFKNSIMLNSGNIEGDLVTHKMLALIEMFEDINESKELEALYKHGYPYLEKLVDKSQKSPITPYEIMTYINDRFSFQYVCVLCVFMSMGGEIDKEHYTYMDFSHNMLLMYKRFVLNEDTQGRFDYSKVNAERASKLYKWLIGKKYDNFNDFMYDFRNEKANEGAKGIKDYLDIIVESEGLDLEEMLHFITARKEDWYSVADLTVAAYPYKVDRLDRLNENEREVLFDRYYSGIVVKQLTRVYKELKGKYLKDVFTVGYDEVNYLRGELSDRDRLIGNMERELNELRSENTRLRDSYKSGLEKEVVRLESEIVNRDLVISEMGDKEILLGNEVRELTEQIRFYKSMVSENFESEIKFRDLIQGRVVVVCCDDRVIKKIGEIIEGDSEIKIINNERFDEGIVRSADRVVIVWDKISHSVYYRVKKVRSDFVYLESKFI